MFLPSSMFPKLGFEVVTRLLNPRSREVWNLVTMFILV